MRQSNGRKLTSGALRERLRAISAPEWTLGLRREDMSAALVHFERKGMFFETVAAVQDDVVAAVRRLVARQRKSRVAGALRRFAVHVQGDPWNAVWATDQFLRGRRGTRTRVVDDAVSAAPTQTIARYRSFMWTR